jgi:hypothetical protein
MAWSWWTPRKGIIPQALTADAMIISYPTPDQPENIQGNPRRLLYRTPDEWQREVWDFYDTLGEFGQGVTWKSNMLSRVRLRVAKRTRPDEEPEPVSSGPAVDILNELAGGVTGQAALMSSFGVYLTVPGECYLIGETDPYTEQNTWYTRSIEEVIPAYVGQDYRFKVSEGNGRWRVLPNDSMVVRVWRGHKRWHNVATSPARYCRPLLRELELINRHIQSQYLSRLASAGIVIFPEEVSFPVRPEFADAPDPFVAEWIEIAAEAIRTPGTAAAVVPIPIKVPGEYVEKIKHVDFTLKLDEKIIEKRNNGLSRLAISLDMPPEALLGTRDVNHWNAWLIDEQGVKIHVAPDAEIICDALTKGYLIPRLEASGQDTKDLIVWYDASNLILRPDKSKNAADAYDRGELSGETYRRESGFDDSDKPSDEERKRILLTRMTLNQPVNAPAALSQLFPEVKDDMVPKPADAERPPAQVRPPAEDPQGARTPPEQPDTRQRAAEAEEMLVAALTKQAGLTHAIRISFNREWELLHPPECRDHLFGCPVTHATWKPPVTAMPGTSGLYECWLNPHGQPIIGSKMSDTSVDGWIESTLHTSSGPVLLDKA